MSKRVLAWPLLILLGSGCGGSGGSSATGTGDSAANPPAANNPPTINGSPLLEIMADEPYSFTPVAADADGDRLGFSIRNRPVWASFDTGSGALTGRPAANEIGTTVGIAISVSDGTDTASLAAFDIEVLPRPAGTAIVSWQIPTTNADGSELADLAGFAVHYGQASASYSETATISDDTATSAAIGDLVPGEWFFAVSAFDTSGNHSELSDEVSKVVAE